MTFLRSGLEIHVFGLGDGKNPVFNKSCKFLDYERPAVLSGSLMEGGVLALGSGKLEVMRLLCGAGPVYALLINAFAQNTSFKEVTVKTYSGAQPQGHAGKAELQELTCDIYADVKVVAYSIVGHQDGMSVYGKIKYYNVMLVEFAVTKLKSTENYFGADKKQIGTKSGGISLPSMLSKS